MKCAILQPSYIPWRGYFHQIQKVDVFVFYDDVQYDKHGWRNRNRIKTRNGSVWLTVPVRHKGNTENHTPINEVSIIWDQAWDRKHLLTLRQAYSRSPYWDTYHDMVEGFFSSKPARLVDLTIESTVTLARALGLGTKFVRSSDLAAEGQKSSRLLSILKSLGASHYVSGPSARDYIDEKIFLEAGISLEYMTYGYPEYGQLYPPYDPQVSILDLLFMKGSDAPKWIW